MDVKDERTTKGSSVTAIGAPALRFQLFGHLGVFVDGAPFRMATPRKTLPVLAYLLLNRHAQIARSHLAYQIWPDETDEDARSKLRSTLYDLVRALPPAPDGGWLNTDAASVGFAPSAQMTTDVEEFDAAAADDDRLERAVDLYAGDLLEAVYDEWIIAPRERYRSAYLDALERLVQRCRRRAEFSRAIAYAKRLLDTDPLREDVARLLIALRYEAGDRAGAIDEFERFKKLVREELDIDPMPETLALRQAIARNEAATHAATAADAARQLPARTRLPFVGRSAEMEQLLEAWSRAARGRGGTVFLGGDPGIGKSRLVIEFSKEVEQRGGRAIFGITGAPESMPYQAFVEAMRSGMPLIESVKLEGVQLSSLATLLPELSSRYADIGALPRIDPDSERARLLDSMTKLLLSLAKARPLLLVLEDLHWAAEATIGALNHAAKRVPLAPVLVVATYRDNETIGRHPLRRARIDLAHEGIARSLLLRPLSLDDVRSLTSALEVEPNASAAALHQASEGVPLMLAELLEDRAEIDPARPSSMTTVIRERLDRLSPDARRLAEIAALFGPRFSREVVREVGGWGAAPFGDALDELLDRRIVGETSGRGALDYAFTHQMIRDVAVDSASQQRAPDRHRRIAKTLEALHPELSDEFAAALGRHYEIAGDPDAAASHYLIAATRALALAAVADSRALVDRGLAVVHDRALEIRLLAKLGEIAERSSDNEALRRAADRLEELARSGGDKDVMLTAALLRVRYEVNSQDQDAHRKALERLGALAAEAPDVWKARHRIEEARFAFGRGDLVAAGPAAQSALEAANAAGDATSAARARVWLAEALSQRGEFSEAVSLLEEARAEALATNDGSLELDALRTWFMLAYSTGNAPRALEISGLLLDRALGLGDRYAEANARMRIGLATTATRGDLRKAREEFAKAKRVFDELNWQRGSAGTLLNLAVLENEVGNFAEGIALTKAALDIFVNVDDARGRMVALSNLSTLHATVGDGSEAVRCANESLAIVRANGMRPSEAIAMENLAIATAVVGDLRGALAYADEALLIHRDCGVRSRGGRFMGDVATWHAALGDLNAARASIDAMLEGGNELWSEWPQRYHWTAAIVLRATGEQGKAEDQLARARELVGDLERQLSGEELERFRAVSWNRAIISASENDAWPDFPGKTP